MTDLTLLEGALADGTRKFKGNPMRNYGIWCDTGSLIMEWRRMRDRMRADRKRQ